MPTIPEALAMAVQHHQGGRLQAAEQIYRQILAVDAHHPDAWHLLGIVACQVGKHQAGVECIQRAVEHRPDWAEAYFNLGNAWREQGKLIEAIGCYQRVLQLKPDWAEAYNNLGVARMSQGNPQEAIACYQRALQRQPEYAEAQNNMGIAQLSQGKPDEAAACFQLALHLNPDYAEAHNNLGNVRMEQGKFDEAVDCFQRSLQLKPDFAEAHNNLGNAWLRQRRLDDAVASYQRTLQLKPDFADAHYQLGNARRQQGRFDEAADCYQRVLRLKPDFFEAHNNLGTVCLDQGKLDEAAACFQRTLELNPDFADARSNLLRSIQYRADVTLSELAKAHAEYDRLHAAPLWTAQPPHENDRDPHRRLRVGFVSPDFGRHPTGYFLILVLENLDRSQMATVCYSDRLDKDDLTMRIQAATANWRDVSGLTDKQLTETIRADRIDILFDLAGHTARNRLLVFARKPSPIQVTWAGYVGTTGLKAMDYILADRYEIPRDAEEYYRERVLRMPDGYVTYDPPGYAPAVSPLPALKHGNVTFGSFNNVAKITAQTIEIWARLLARVPQSRLVLKYRGLDHGSIANGLADKFANHRIDPQRVEYLGWSAHATLLAEYHRIDLALDPLPYNGGLTTCEALWMGVPVISVPGETFASRHSLSHLANVGLMETVARNVDEYVELAVSLSGDLPRLAAMRAGLRERMAASPLCDGRRFAVNLTTILRDAWREWCHKDPARDPEWSL